MRLPFTLLLALFASQSVYALTPAKRHYSTHDYYVLEHQPGTGASLDECAQAIGVELVEQAGELLNHWIVRIEKRSTYDLSSRATTEQDRVLDRFESLRTQAGSNRDSLFFPRSTETQQARRVVSSIKYLSRQTLRKRVKRDDSFLVRAPPPIIEEPAKQDPNASSQAIALRMGITDPLFNKQWHLVNDEFPQHMMNVTPLWDMGFTGEGIISALVDDGLDYRSDDLAGNFDAAGSYDFNDHVDLPTPVLFDDHHGTRCAGQIAALKNNVCGVGIAYKSKVAGLRILSGTITDVDEAAALNYAYQNTSIYSCSWGPPDDGRSMEGPAYLIKKAVVNGIQEGRGGKGSIFVFASGNGAANGDQCNFDGYTNSIYSVTVSAVDYKGLHPYYSESCAANLVVAYSSGSGNHITTTDVGKDKCSSSHGGTSAAAPNAVGVFVLALQARPDLTWRDIQHLCVQSSQMVNPEDPDWETTAAGRPFNYKYGYGILDAYHYVTAAQSWKNVKPQAWFEIPAIQIAGGTMNILKEMSGGEPIVPGGVRSSTVVTKKMMESENFEKLEHVTIKVWISHTKRGDVEVELLSPNGIKSMLAAPRISDSATTGYPGWTFMTVKHWDEDPVGEWTIRVSDQTTENHNGSFLGWSMTFWGSTIDASKAKVYVLPTDDSPLPPIPSEEATTTISAPVNTKTHPKPTVHPEPGDHTSDKLPSGSPTMTPTPTPPAGWVPGMSNLLSSQKWFFIAISAVVLFGISAGVFFWRRRAARRRRAIYTSLAGDDVAMSSVARDGRPSPGGARAKELYDAFGEVSDDEDADEETGLRPRAHGDGTPSGRLGFHSGFLDDEDMASAGPTPNYKDEPDGARHSREEERPHSPGSVSGDGSGSGDGSWEHASQTR